MAPEILEGKYYAGESVDLFASGIILFILVAKGFPFHSAQPTETYYRMIKENRPDLFWKLHSKNWEKNNSYPESIGSEHFLNFLIGLLQYEPH
jgi:serine/threonine protein kinase